MDAGAWAVAGVGDALSPGHMPPPVVLYQFVRWGELYAQLLSFESRMDLKHGGPQIMQILFIMVDVEVLLTTAILEAMVMVLHVAASPRLPRRIT